MNIFTYHFKRWWMDESSPRYLRDFLQMTWLGLQIARLYEQGASKRRVGLYLARWLGWAACACVPLSHALTCTDPPNVITTPPYSICRCGFDMSAGITVEINRWKADGSLLGAGTGTKQCTGVTDTVCGPLVTSTVEKREYYKNTTGTDSYFSCYWTPSSGYSSPQIYTPTTPAASIYRVPVTGGWVIFALLLAGGAITSLWRNRSHRK